MHIITQQIQSHLYRYPEEAYSTRTARCEDEGRGRIITRDIFALRIFAVLTIRCIQTYFWSFLVMILKFLDKGVTGNRSTKGGV